MLHPVEPPLANAPQGVRFSSPSTEGFSKANTATELPRCDDSYLTFCRHTRDRQLRINRPSSPTRRKSQSRIHICI
ncbi:hypothetical protein J3458_000549 [Metarhizium acridum]|uniref:uncharacterized protein n=1 Tax=Metarhizium acridum TaxID=92637 RepID=UPI001C6BB537|nr:hypothetical protein J3458_000549 [Metarhizium acridum]